MLNKLWENGIRGVSYQWFESYLSNRKQYINIDNYKTKLENVEEGVPQGGNLASTLFLMYINNIIETDLHREIFLYADDMIAIVYNSKR